MSAFKQIIPLDGFPYRAPLLSMHSPALHRHHAQPQYGPQDGHAPIELNLLGFLGNLGHQFLLAVLVLLVVLAVLVVLGLCMP